MIVYLLKSASCLALMLFFYHLILEKEKMHIFNRFYLLGSILFSFLAPLATITISTVPEILTEGFHINESLNSEKLIPIVYEESVNYTQIFIFLYSIISLILFIRFCRNLFIITRKIKNNQSIKYLKATLILVEDIILPHTFWNYIFINKYDYKNGKIEDEIFTHELTHVIQKHTIDVILIELLQVIFWINPMFIYIKKAVQINHEFLADETVLNKYKNTFQYQYLLLNKATWKNEYYLASNLNYSLTKKRLKMMTTQSSKSKILLKKLAVIPLLTGFVFLFAKRIEAQEKQKVLETIYEQEPTKNNKLNDSEIYKEFVYKNGFITFKDKNGKKISKKYSELTKEERLKIPPPPPLKTKKKTPSKKIIEDLKNHKKYALWIDGKVVKNEILKKYDASDFSNYSVSLVHKNARSKRFFQEYQANLYTHKYFKEKNEKRVIDFKNYLEKSYKVETITEDNIYSLKAYEFTFKKYESLRNSKPHYIKSSIERKKNIDFLYSKLGSLYFKLSKEDKKKVKRPVHPHEPYVKLMKNNKVFYKLRNDLTKEDKLLIPPPPPPPNASKEQILKAKKAYKAWKKRTGNDFPVPPPPPRNHLDQVIKMAKKGATFYYEGKRINSDKAISLLKKNNKLNIHSKSTNNSNYEVWISKKPFVKEIKK